MTYKCKYSWLKFGSLGRVYQELLVQKEILGKLEDQGIKAAVEIQDQQVQKESEDTQEHQDIQGTKDHKVSKVTEETMDLTAKLDETEILVLLAHLVNLAEEDRGEDGEEVVGLVFQEIQDIPVHPVP